MAKKKIEFYAPEFSNVHIEKGIPLTPVKPDKKVKKPNILTMEVGDSFRVRVPQFLGLRMFQGKLTGKLDYVAKKNKIKFCTRLLKGRKSIRVWRIK